MTASQELVGRGRPAGWRRRVLPIACGLGVLIVAALAIRHWMARRDPGSSFSFEGVVVDEAGRPLPGATVLLEADRYSSTTAFLAPMDDTGAPRPVDLTLTTDGRGRFAIHDQPGDWLKVLDVRKPGYVWLVDYGWVPGTAYGQQDNRDYLFAMYPAYLPDPPVFPLIRVGSRTIYPPSRGGQNRYRDGKIVRNGPWQPLVPSTGPNAPTSESEMERRIVALPPRSPR